MKTNEFKNGPVLPLEFVYKMHENDMTNEAGKKLNLSDLDKEADQLTKKINKIGDTEIEKVFIAERKN